MNSWNMACVCLFVCFLTPAPISPQDGESVCILSCNSPHKHSEICVLSQSLTSGHGGGSCLVSCNSPLTPAGVTFRCGAHPPRALPPPAVLSAAWGRCQLLCVWRGGECWRSCLLISFSFCHLLVVWGLLFPRALPQRLVLGLDSFVFESFFLTGLLSIGISSSWN